LRKARNVAPDVPAILLTGYTETPDLIEALNSRQVFRFIRKPWSVDDLVQTVRSALDGVALRRQNKRLAVDNERRLRALELIHQIGQTAATSSSVTSFAKSLADGIAEICPVDVVGTLVLAESGASPVMSMHCPKPVSESALEGVQEALCASFADFASEPLKLEDVIVRIHGRTSSQDAAQRLGTLRVFKLETGRDTFGLLALGCEQTEGLSVADERAVQIVSSHAGEVLSALHARVDAERRRSLAVIDQVRDGLIQTSPQGEILSANEAAAELIGVDELVGQQIFSLLGTEPFSLMRQVELSRSSGFRERVNTRKGTLNVEVTPVFDAQGKLDTLVYRIEVPARRSHALLSFVSNELRTPLTSVEGALELLL
ncbi:MAG: PAS domain-containing protein, partial [Myxococcota bacterium]